MADVRLVLLQTRYQLTSMAHNRRTMVLSVVFPVVLLVLFNSVFVNGSKPIALAGLRVAPKAYFTGGLLAYAIMAAGFNQLAISLVGQRETGQLKRLRGTPVPAWTLISATVLRAVVTTGAMAVVMLLIARFAYDVGLSAEAVGALALYVILGTAAMCSVAIAASTLVPDVDSASAALPLAAVVLALISGVFVPVDQLPDWLEHVARVFPLYHLAAGLQTALGSSGAVLHSKDIASLAIWALAGTLYAARHFRWEPQVTRAAA